MEKKEYEKMSEYGVEFKNIISGPAPVGRVLNYTIRAGNQVLNHKNGYRSLDLKDNIGSAWCTEFMVGLGLIRYEVDKRKEFYPIFLTNKGQKLFSLLQGFEGWFDEDNDASSCKEQLLNFSKDAYNYLEYVFKSSIILKNLITYIINNQTNVFLKNLFMDDYFEFFKRLYEGSTTYNRNSRTSTAKNRVPSLIQFCEFFNYVYTDKDTNGETIYVFNLEKMTKSTETYDFIELTGEVLQQLKKESDYNEKMAQYLVEKYGINGTVVHEIISRNSSVQQIFRNNLISKYGLKCMLCEKYIDEVLIASHIKPASECDVVSKANCENGLLLCALHDKLFDRYLISFDFTTGKLLYSKILESQLAEYQLKEGFTLPEAVLTPERRNFLMEHNMEFYKRNK